eukprot:GFUD01105299.1.p1 GENE.GFUD01105299.1~~GFUD01105299.1.p1  ORF type:complete len:310 (-),score=114.14 GFUD01105299.1:4-810(-)
MGTMDIKDTEYSNGDSTFITEIEDTEEIMLDNENVEKITQLEKTLNESEKEFPVEETVGEVNEAIAEEIIENDIDLTNLIESEARDESLVIDVTEPEATLEEIIENNIELTEPIESEATEPMPPRPPRRKKTNGSQGPSLEHNSSVESDGSGVVIDVTEPESPLTEEVNDTETLAEAVDKAAPEEIIENKIEVIEPIEVNDESLVIDVTDPAAIEAALTEEAKDAETNIIAAPINIVTTEVHGTDKRPMFTLVMVAYVVFMAVIVLLN